MNGLMKSRQMIPGGGPRRGGGNPRGFQRMASVMGAPAGAAGPYKSPIFPKAERGQAKVPGFHR